MFKKIGLLLLVLLALIIGYFVLWPSPITPDVWTAPKAPELTGQYEVNDKLAALEILHAGQCEKCEDVAVDSMGRIYGGQLNGDIIEFDQGKRRIVANTGGRPLGLHFDAAGHLIVADAAKGLLSIEVKTGKTTVLVDEYKGRKMIFVDDVEVAADSMIYFSDASSKWGFHDNALDILEGRGNGFLYQYNPKTKITTELLGDLRFANGIAVAHDQSYVLVNETGRYRTHRYWLKGPKAGQSDLFIENLPGFPDGISQGENGLYWLAIVSPRQQALDDISNSVFLKNVVAKMPKFMQPGPVHYGFVLGIDSNGKIVHNLQDPSSKFSENTSVQQVGNVIYIGSLYENGIARMSIN
ncbi:MAG: SMP-30/gluconolactonase/LRE family protein [Saprospiraceae bacterium]